MPSRRTRGRDTTGQLLVFEGIDGAGKSTQIRLLARFLERERGGEVLVLREPGGTPLGDALRALLLEPGDGDLTAATEVFLFMAARAHLVTTRIAPALARGATVICDRFYWSSVVYQGIAGGLGIDPVLRMARVAVGDVRPARTFVLDLPVPAVLRRKSFDRVGDRIERRGRRFQERVRKGFLDLARRFPRQLDVIDARGTPEEVHARVLDRLPAPRRRSRA